MLTMASQGANVTFLYQNNENAAYDTLEAATGLSGVVKAKKIDIRNAGLCNKAIIEIAETTGKSTSSSIVLGQHETIFLA